MRKLYIKQFGPVKEANLELRNVNLFIGEQSVGKSTIAKMITILTDYIILSKLIRCSDVIWTSLWREHLKAYNLDVYMDDDYEIVYDMEEGEVHFHLEICPRQLSSYMTKGKKEIQSKEQITLELFKLKPFFHKKKVVEGWKKAREESQEVKYEKVQELMTNSLYIPAERIIHSVITNLMPALMLAEASTPKNLLRFMTNLNNAKSTYSKCDIPFLNVSYLQKDSDDYIVVTENGKELPLSYASSGIQSSLPLWLVLKYAIEHCEYSSFVVEEPECNLFPEKQVELLKLLLQMVKGNQRTLTITTHSPYLLSAMNNYLFAGTLVGKFKGNIKDDITNILPKAYHLKLGECSVYSLGEDINGDGIYCQSLIDEETGMINYNSLDTASVAMSAEFEALENAYIQMMARKS